MGQEEVPGHVEAGGDGRAEQEGGGLEQGGAEAASINLRKNLDGTRRHWKISNGVIAVASNRCVFFIRLPHHSTIFSIIIYRFGNCLNTENVNGT